MTRKQKTFIWIAIALVVSVVAVVRVVRTSRSPAKPILLTGAVLRQDTNPRKQTPIANAKVTAIDGSSSADTTSDSSGLFKLTVQSDLVPGRPITMRFEHAEYKPLEITEGDRYLLYVVRMEPLVRDSVSVPDHTAPSTKAAQINNVRVRYSLKNQTTINVGSVAKQFEVVNTGNVPCRGQRPCSPDGKWKASIGSLSLDAQKGNVLRNVRASCVAGPCPFTRLEPDDLSRPVRTIQITAFSWSDTASFLVEAEVTRTMATDMIRQSFPFITDQTMSFALPAIAEGPSVVADLNGEEIVFPLGPNLILSWATCSVEVAPGGNKIYRCELKPGYQFQQ
jgi:hypothetical protein